MIHLKKFGDSFTRKELEEFCKNYLVGMFDSFTFKLEVSENSDNYTIAMEPVGLVRWDDIKDDFIPFLKMLDSEYSICEYDSGSIRSTKMRIGNGYYLISNILDDAINVDYLYLLYIAVNK